VSKSTTYRDAGVDIAAGEYFVDRIRKACERTRTPQVIGSIGGFGGLFAPKLAGFREPVLVASTDGIGTKLKLAFELDAHHRVGGDLVRHCANDIAVMGAKPLFFLDYLATSKLDAEVLAKLVEGMAEACREEGIALLGGETAEMPGFYTSGEYDVAGFIVGIADRRGIPDATTMREGDALVGLPSTGLHTNGYSLARKILQDSQRKLSSKPKDLEGQTIGDALLAPHKSYTREIALLLGDPAIKVRGFAHITGGGIGGNLKRILPAGLDAVVHQERWVEPPIFGLLREAGNVAEDEMRAAFNLGIGLVAVVGDGAAAMAKIERRKSVRVTVAGKKATPRAFLLGEIVRGKGQVRFPGA
jgi:phosphoribosylformylglycinamidine cyclo-ligase